MKFSAILHELKYGPNAKQLGKIADELFKGKGFPKELEYEAGWYEDGQRDAKAGRKMDFGQCELKVNQDAYVKGYKEAKKK
jgi:hypothetical protein